MIEEQDAEKYRTCLGLLNKAKYGDAVKLANTIQQDVLRAVILIDGGYGLDNPNKVRKGISLLEGVINLEPIRKLTTTDTTDTTEDKKNGKDL